MIVTGKGETEKKRPVSNAEINHELKSSKRMFSLAVESGSSAYQPKVPMLKENNARTGSSSPSSSRRSVGTYRRTCAARHVRVSDRLAPQRSDGPRVAARRFRRRRSPTRPGTTKNDEGRTFPFTGRAARVARGSTRRTPAAQEGRDDRAVGVLADARQTGSRTGRRARQRAEADRHFRKTWIAACERRDARDGSRTTSAARRCATWCARAFPSAWRCR